MAQTQHMTEFMRRDPHRQRVDPAAELRVQQDLGPAGRGRPDRSTVAEAAAAERRESPIVDADDGVGVLRAEHARTETCAPEVVHCLAAITSVSVMSAGP